MIRITDQYFWNFVFVLFFAALVIMGAIILQTEAYRPLDQFTAIDFILLALATWRLIRLFVYDAITKFFREQFWDASKSGKQVILQKPTNGPRRTLADLLSCPWCIGVWAAAALTFFYAVSPYAYFLVVFLAISSVATFMQLLTNLVGHKAEQLKRQNGD